jgi:hypothetical protein
VRVETQLARVAQIRTSPRRLWKCNQPGLSAQYHTALSARDASADAVPPCRATATFSPALWAVRAPCENANSACRFYLPALRRTLRAWACLQIVLYAAQSGPFQ